MINNLVRKIKVKLDKAIYIECRKFNDYYTYNGATRCMMKSLPIYLTWWKKLPGAERLRLMDLDPDDVIAEFKEHINQLVENHWTMYSSTTIFDKTDQQHVYLIFSNKDDYNTMRLIYG